VLFRDKADTSFPARRRVIQNVIDPEAIREHGDEVVEFGPEQNIFLVDVGVDEAEFGRITRVEKSITDDLKHGCDTSSASDETELGGEFGRVFELALGPLDADFVASLDTREIARDVSLLIGLIKSTRMVQISGLNEMQFSARLPSLQGRNGQGRHCQW